MTLRKYKGFAQRWQPAFFVLVIILVGGAAVRPVQGGTENPWLAPFRYPAEGAAFLEKSDIKGNMFNSVRQGGYLVWKLFPRKLCFVDGRLILRSEAFFRDYIEILDKPDKFYRLCGQYNITHALLPLSINDRYLPLAEMLYRDKNWKLVFVNESEVLFARCSVFDGKAIDLASRKTRELILKKIRRKYQNKKILGSRAIYNINRFWKRIGVEQT